MFKKNTLAVGVASLVIAVSAHSENEYAATLKGAVTADYTTIPLLAGPDPFANTYNIPAVPELGNSQMGFMPGPGGAMTMNLVLNADGSPSSIETISDSLFISGASPAAVTAFHPGNTVLVRTRPLPVATPNPCTLDTSVLGTVDYNCIPADPENDLGLDDNDGAMLVIPFDWNESSENAYGFECWGFNQTADQAGQNGCGTIGDLSAVTQAAACPVTPVQATYDAGAGDVNLPDFPGMFAPSYGGVDLPMLECPDDRWRARMYGKITATAQAEAFRLTYTYTGTLGEPDFEVTGAFYNSFNIGSVGVPRTTERYNRFGIDYDAVIAAAVPLGLDANTAHPSNVQTTQAFTGASSKNVPAMGAFGLAALFGGLIAVAARLRRRVS